MIIIIMIILLWLYHDFPYHYYYYDNNDYYYDYIMIIIIIITTTYITYNHVDVLYTSAVWENTIPASCLQALDMRWANQFVTFLAAEHNLTSHQEVTAVPVTELWCPRVLTLYWL